MRVTWSWGKITASFDSKEAQCLANALASLTEQSDLLKLLRDKILARLSEME